MERKPFFYEPHCPIRNIRVRGRSQVQYVEGVVVLSVGTIPTNQKVKKRIKQLVRIQRSIDKKCKRCPGNTRNGGECAPASYFRGGIINTVIVGDREKLPAKVTSSEYFYKEH